ncbi:MAG TPA: ring-cleaving dioxygenase [Gemmatimonadaceae bacterium]|nr:ring-cleaving dioxygenase [Gemmatimonadaceae bacterium]
MHRESGGTRKSRNIIQSAGARAETMQLHGIHHLTAVSASIRENLRFYTTTMGMRLVKRSVNQDDVSAYHLFYADARGTPGTDFTFFDWDMQREKRGTNSITRTGLRVNGRETLDWWAARFQELGVANEGVGGRDERLILDFEDVEGQRLTLVDDAGEGDEPAPWEQSPVPAEYQIRGLGPIVMSVPDLAPTATILTQLMEMRPLRVYDGGGEYPHDVHVFGMDGTGPSAELHVAVEPRLPRARLGAGGVHHVAFRTPDEAEYHAWAKRLNEFGIPNSGEIDRYYFRSLYFREPGHILFEIATDGPGFGVDEDPSTLGERVALPPFLESRREEIVSNLKQID